MTETDKKRDELIYLLKMHDWHYKYADDHREYSNGRAEYEKIIDLMKEVADGTELYTSYYNKAFPKGG